MDFKELFFERPVAFKKYTDILRRGRDKLPCINLI